MSLPSLRWLTFSLAILVFSSDSRAAEIRWLDDLKQAEVEVQRSQRPMLLQVTAPWCGYCHKMLRETYRDPAVVSTVHSNYVAVRLNADKHPDLIRALKITAFPTVALLSPDYQTIHKIAGFKKAAEFNGSLQTLARQLTPPAVVTVQAKADSVAVAAEPSVSVQAEPSVSVQAEPSVSVQAEPSVSVQAEPSVAVQAEPSVAVQAEPVKTPPLFDGICLVSLLDDRKLEPGRAEFALLHRGHMLRFASAAQRQAFEEQPARYWPVHDGVCPVSLQDGHADRVGQPRLGVLYDGRVWFFHDVEHRKRFLADPQAFAARVR